MILKGTVTDTLWLWQKGDLSLPHSTMCRGVAVLWLWAGSAAAIAETERVAEFRRRGWTWPPTWQPATQDLSEISAPVNAERKDLLVQFDEWAALVRPRLSKYWSDVSCPMEGHSRYGTPTSAIYNELDGLGDALVEARALKPIPAKKLVDAIRASDPKPA